MALPVSFYSLTVNDNTVRGNGRPESASIEVPVATLTAANYVAKKVLIDDLYVALMSIAIGMPARSQIVIDRAGMSTAPAATTLAQRENKFLIRYHDSVTQQKFQASMPTADLTVLPNNSEFVDLTAGGGLDVKNAFEAIVVSPNDAAHTVVVDSIQFVGRNT